MPKLTRIGYDDVGPRKLIAFVGDDLLVVRRPGSQAHLMSMKEWEALSAEPMATDKKMPRE